MQYLKYPRPRPRPGRREGGVEYYRWQIDIDIPTSLLFTTARQLAPRIPGGKSINTSEMGPGRLQATTPRIDANMNWRLVQSHTGHKLSEVYQKMKSLTLGARWTLKVGKLMTARCLMNLDVWWQPDVWRGPRRNIAPTLSASSTKIDSKVAQHHGLYIFQLDAQ